MSKKSKTTLKQSPSPSPNLSLNPAIKPPLKTPLDKSSVTQLYHSKIKFRLFSLFEIYRSLTLQEAADILGRDKSSIHPHMQFLIEVGLLQEPSKVDKNRNNIYELAPDYDQKIRNLDSFHDYSQGLTADLLTNMLASGENLVRMEKFLLEEELRFHKYLNGIKSESDGFEKLWAILQPILQIKVDKENQILRDKEGNLITESISSNTLYYFDRNTFLEFKQEYFNLIRKFEEIQEKRTKEDPKLPRTVCFIGHSLALKPILTVNTKKN